MRRDYTLLLRLEGPMQVMGYRSRFDYRDTALEPTRSGVIGLICAAVGIARGEDILRFDSIRMGVRVDKEGRPERDYHTALDVIKADGKGTDTVVSYRDYLADASFTVGLQSEDLQLLRNIADALQRPPMAAVSRAEGISAGRAASQTWGGAKRGLFGRPPSRGRQENTRGAGIAGR